MTVAEQSFLDNAYLLYFVNGLAYFVMGLTISLELRRAQFLRITDKLWLLSVHAFLSSIGNWLEMVFRMPGNSGVLRSQPLVQAGVLSLFVVSSLFLIAFGLQALGVSRPNWQRRRWFLALFGLAYLGVLAAILMGPAIRNGDWLPQAETWARIMLYLPGLALSGLAVWLQRSHAGLEEANRDLGGAAISFWLKSFVSGSVALPILGSINSLPLILGASVQALRTLTTVGITFFLVRVLHASEGERQRQLGLSAQARLEEQERALQVQRQTCEEIQLWSASLADVVHRISSAISQPLEIEEMMHLVLRETLRIAGLQRGIAMLLDEEKQLLVQVAHLGVPEWFRQALRTVRVGDGLAGWVAEKGEVLIVEDVANDSRPFVPKTTDVVQFYAGIPLQAGGRVLGVMNLAHGQPHHLTPQQIALLTSAGHQLGVAINAARLSDQLRGMVALEERARLSRELHDNLLQVLAYMHLKSQMAERLLGQYRLLEVKEELREMEQISSRAYDDVRDSIAGLRVTISSEGGLLAALEEHTRHFEERSQIAVTMDTAAWRVPFLSRDMEVQLLRIVQEALTNVRRHSGASAVKVILTSGDHTVSVVVRDDGRGFDPTRVGRDGQQHLGLQTMRERAESVGGTLDIQSEPGQGTEIRLALPLKREKGLT